MSVGLDSIMYKNGASAIYIVERSFVNSKGGGGGKEKLEEERES